MALAVFRRRTRRPAARRIAAASGPPRESVSLHRCRRRYRRPRRSARWDRWRAQAGRCKGIRLSSVHGFLVGDHVHHRVLGRRGVSPTLVRAVGFPAGTGQGGVGDQCGQRLGASLVDAARVAVTGRAGRLFGAASIRAASGEARRAHMLVVPATSEGEPNSTVGEDADSRQASARRGRAHRRVRRWRLRFF